MGLEQLLHSGESLTRAVGGSNHHLEFARLGKHLEGGTGLGLVAYDQQVSCPPRDWEWMSQTLLSGHT
jgi:hypothetical protein